MLSTKAYYKFSSTYFFFYFGLGAVLPLYALYLASIGLSGTQIGTLTATGAFIGIFSGPIWGFISDRSHAHKGVLLGLMVGVVITAFLITRITSYAPLFIVFCLFYIVFSPINPLLDGITLHSPLPFGKIRLWGSIGFAIAAYVTGSVADRTDLVIIFYALMISVFIAGLSLKNTDVSIKHAEVVNMKVLLQLLSNKRFIAFLIYTMLITSTIGGMNIYFSLYFQSIGGNIALVGLAFLLFALSEVPFMQLTAIIMAKYGPYKLLVVVPFLGIIRWGFYGFTHSPTAILWTFALQGIFYAPMLVGAAEFVRLELPANLRTTGIALYTAVGFGLGGVFINYFSGYLYDNYSANTIFFSYAVLCAVAIGFLPFIYKSHKNES